MPPPPSTHALLLYQRGSRPTGVMTWHEVRGGKMKLSCWGAERRGPRREWGLGRKAVKVDLQWGQIWKLWEASQELHYLEGCRPHILRSKIHWMCRKSIACLTQSWDWGFKGEGVQGCGQPQDFRGSVQQGHIVSDSHLWVKPGLVGIRGKQSHWISGEQ